MNYNFKREEQIQQAINVKPKIPRPSNAFMLYANENRKTMAQMYPTESNKEISKRLGNSWKSLESKDKDKYFDRAKSIDIEHKKRYPNYVYNPKEARIRKALREATRDRSIGASPMLPRPNARRPASHWMTSHEEPLMLSPITGMRSPLDSSGCNFPISGPAGAGFMSPMNGYNKMETQMLPATPVHTNYVQQNPLAQLQHQTELWHPYQDSMRSRTSGNNFMRSTEINSYTKQLGTTLGQQQHIAKNSEVVRLMNEKETTPDEGNSSCATITETTSQQNRHSSVAAAASSHEQSNADNVEDSTSASHYLTAPATPPRTNENVPPDVPPAVNNQDIDDILTTQNEPPTTPYNEKLIALQSNENLHEHEDPFMSVYKENVRSPYNNVSIKSKKTKVNVPSTPNEEIYLPLSSCTFSAPQELLSDSVEYHRDYIIKFFQKLNGYELYDVTALDDSTFPYVTLTPPPPLFVSPLSFAPDLTNTLTEQNFIPTDVGYIPIFDNGSCEENMFNIGHL